MLFTKSPVGSYHSKTDLLSPHILSQRHLEFNVCAEPSNMFDGVCLLENYNSVELEMYFPPRLSKSDCQQGTAGWSGFLSFRFQSQSEAGGNLPVLAAASNCSVAGLSEMVNRCLSSSCIANVAEVV